MIFARRSTLSIETDRLSLRLPALADYRDWAALRINSRSFLQPWEPSWSHDHLSKAAYRARVRWARQAVREDRGLPLFITRRDDGCLVGAITLSNVRRGPAMAASTGYWIGAAHQRQGYMREALIAVVHYAFQSLDLGRLEAGCLPENAASRALLEQCGYKYEGVAQSYLQINGRWRNHVLYANLRSDRRGKAS